MNNLVKLEDKKVLIICKDAGEANFYAKQYGWETWQFVSSISALALQKDVVIVYVGLWHERRDLNRVNEIVDEMIKSGKAYIPLNKKMQRYKIHPKNKPEVISYNTVSSYSPYSVRGKSKVR